MSAMTVSPHLLAEIDRRVAALLKRKFKSDPILGQASRMVSRLASLAKIDGSILQHAIEDAIRCRPDVTVLAEPVIPISDSAKRLSAGGNYETCLGTDVRFGDRVVDSVTGKPSVETWRSEMRFRACCTWFLFSEAVTRNAGTTMLSLWKEQASLPVGWWRLAECIGVQISRSWGLPIAVSQALHLRPLVGG